MIQSRQITYKWELLALLWGTFFLGQGDRQVLNVVLPLIRDDLGLTDTQMGLIATMMMIALGIMAPISGRLGDLKNRKYLLIFSTTCWAIASLFTGMSSALLLLILWRTIAAGGGEAFYGPSGFALIGVWHKDSRSTAMAIHQTALYLGVIVAGYGAGYLGEHFGWRVPFLVSGVLGISMALLLLWRMRSEPVNNVYSEHTVHWKDILQIFSQKKSVLFLSIAFVGMVFSTLGYLTWMPTFLHESLDMSLDRAGFHSLFWHHLAAMLGVLIGGKWTDIRMRKTKTARVDIQIIALLSAIPFIIWMGQGESLLSIGIAMAGFGLFRGMYDTNIFAAVFDVLPDSVHSLVVGFMTLTAFVAASLAPLILGAFKDSLGLDWGISFLFIGYFIGGLAAWLGARRYIRSEWEESNEE